MLIIIKWLYGYPAQYERNRMPDIWFIMYMAEKLMFWGITSGTPLRKNLAPMDFNLGAKTNQQKKKKNETKILA